MLQLANIVQKVKYSRRKSNQKDIERLTNDKGNVKEIVTIPSIMRRKDF